MTGDSKGQIRVFNCVNGELMKTLEGHGDAEILALMAVQTKEMAIIVSVGGNNVVQVHEDDKLTQTAVRRVINIPNYEIQAARVYLYGGLKLLMVGLNKGQLKIYELETGRPDASYPAYEDAASDITEIYAGMTKKPLFFTTDNHGKVSMWVGPPSLAKYTKAFEFVNVDEDQSGEPAAVTCIAYNEEDELLYLGDERGNVVAHCMGEVVASAVDLERDTTGRKEGFRCKWRHKEHSESIRHLKYFK